MIRTFGGGWAAWMCHSPCLSLLSPVTAVDTSSCVHRHSLAQSSRAWRWFGTSLGSRVASRVILFASLILKLWPPVHNSVSPLPPSYLFGQSLWQNSCVWFILSAACLASQPSSFRPQWLAFEVMLWKFHGVQGVPGTEKMDRTRARSDSHVEFWSLACAFILVL